MVGACSGWKCNRMLSISSGPEPNQYAVQHPESFSVEFAICVDCKRMFCDRCTTKRRGHTGSPACASCGGHLADGRRHWEEVERMPYPEAVTHYNKARKLGESRQMTAALSELEYAVRLRPDYPAALFDLGVVLREQGRDRHALQVFDELLRVDPGNAQAAFDKGAVHLDLGDTQAAIDAFDLAIRIEPRFAEPYVNKASSFMQAGRYEETLATCGQAIDLLEKKQNVGRADRTLAIAYGVLGACLLNMGRDADGLDALDRAIDNGLDDARTLRNRALALQRLGRHEEAEVTRQMADDAE